MIPMPDILLVHYSEVGTKGKNRSYFERRLRDDLRSRLAPGQVTDVRVESGRVLAPLVPGYDPLKVQAGLEQVFGVAWYAFAQEVSWEWPQILDAVLARAKAAGSAKTFKVYCHRADKTFPLSSQTACDRLGQAVREQCGLRVDLDHHDLALYVEVVPGRTLVYTEKFPGLRGLPQGTSGRMLCLFSGGIDSPVAAWLMMRRGARAHLLHFHPYRRPEELAGSKIFALYDVLKRFDPGAKLLLIPHFPYQVKAAMDIDPAYEMVLFRRFMFKAGEELAQRRGLHALITGDSLGQVASQTVENMAAAETGLGVPVFRPLIAHDKDEIVRIAQKIGTYELSTQPYKDCCSLMSRHPKTRMSPERVRMYEQKLDFSQLVKEALDELVVWDGAQFRRAAAPPAPAVVSPA
jgi:tRNA uracil 4-sulfurtransferase